MYKKNRTKLGSIGMVMVLLLGLLVLPASAEADNLFTNPELYITESEGGKRVPGWSMYSNATIENILTPGDELYDETVNMEGNMFHSKTNGAGIISNGYLPLNEQNRAVVSLWYKSSRDNTIRLIIEEFNDLNEKIIDSTPTEYLPSTEGEWKKHDYVFTASENATKVKVIIRCVDYSEKINGTWTVTSTVAESNIFFMLPSYSTSVIIPLIVNGDLETNSTSGWSYVSSSENATGIYEVVKEQFGNHYLKVTAPANTQMRTKITTSSESLLAKGDIVKITFKFMPISAGAMPRLDIQEVLENGSTQVVISKSAQGSATILGTVGNERWTEYVVYHTISGEATKRLSLHFYAQKDETAETIAAYDDVTIEKAKNNVMIYQNGVEITTLTPGAAVNARYHNVSDTASKFVMALYEVSADGKTKTLREVSIVTANAGMTVAGDDAVIDTITVPNEGNYQVKAFALNEMNSLTPVIKAKTAKTASAA